jgi:hypothetical protein
MAWVQVIIKVRASAPRRFGHLREVGHTGAHDAPQTTEVPAVPAAWGLIPARASAPTPVARRAPAPW